MNYCLVVNYEEFKPNTYKGITIERINEMGKPEKVLTVNTKKERKVNVKKLNKDVEKALNQLYDLVGEVQVEYLSSYDNYLMDIDSITPSLKDKFDTKRMLKNQRKV